MLPPPSPYSTTAAGDARKCSTLKGSGEQASASGAAREAEEAAAALGEAD